MTLQEQLLESLANELNKAGLRKFTCINGFGYSQTERDIVDEIIEIFDNRYRELKDSHAGLLRCSKDMLSFIKEQNLVNDYVNRPIEKANKI